MRYYRLDLSRSDNAQPLLLASLGGQPITSLLPNGLVNPAALNVEFDIPVINYTPGAQNKSAYFRVWGIGLKDLTQALTLAPSLDPARGGVNVKLLAGMSKGLPLANPAQQGLIMSGGILQAWGNWEGTVQTLDFIFGPVIPQGNSPAAGTNTFPFSWLAGTPLKVALSETLSNAFPGQKQIINISQNLILPSNEYGFYKSVTEFTSYINDRTKALLGNNYAGVSIVSNGQIVTCYDGTVAPAKQDVKAISFQDMIGQPTWLSVNTIIVKLVMRGDLAVSDVIQLPASLTTQTQQSMLNYADRSTFTGKFRIQEIEHFGNFRQPDAASWNTTVTATAELTTPNTTQASPNAMSA